MKDYSKLEMLNVHETIMVDQYVKIDDARKEKNFTEPQHFYSACHWVDDEPRESMDFCEDSELTPAEMAMELAKQIGKEQAARVFLEWARLQTGIIFKHSVEVALDKTPEKIKWFRYSEGNSDFYNACVADHKASMSDPLYGIR